MSLLCLVPLPAIGCSIYGYDNLPEPTRVSAPLFVPPPVIDTVRVTRGHDDGNGASCSDAGLLVFSFGAEAYGYRFSVRSGNLSEEAIPSDDVTPAKGEPRTITFAWLDWPSSPDAPINALVEIRSVNREGHTSDEIVVAVIEE